MSSLTDADKKFFEKLFDMPSGYVLKFSDKTFKEFFARHNVAIHDAKYQTYGTSKAKKLRAFWEIESDDVVYPALSEMLDSYETDCELNDTECDNKRLAKCRSFLLSKSTAARMPDDNDETFLDKEYTIPNLQKLPVEQQVAAILEARLKEARAALSARAYLSVIFLCGSVLEGVLLGAAQNNPEKFNRSPRSPKDNEDKVLPFHQWSLSQFIDTACEVDLLKPDVKKFSHGLRDFRNYIHPYQQMVSGFTPDEHTAKVCFQVLKAALASLAGDR